MLSLAVQLTIMVETYTSMRKRADFLVQLVSKQQEHESKRRRIGLTLTLLRLFRHKQPFSNDRQHGV